MSKSNLDATSTSAVAERAAGWRAIAKRELEQALRDLNDPGQEVPIASTTLALAAMYAEVGESPGTVKIDSADELTEFLADHEPACSCPPDLAARGGWSSRCPAHGRGRESDA